MELSWTFASVPSRLTLTVLDNLGDIRLRQDVVGQGLLLRAEDLSPPLEDQTSMCWYLSAQLTDGTTIESEISSFVWQP